LLEPPPVTYLDRSDEKFPVNFAWREAKFVGNGVGTK